ncbi:type IX secretion system anionic LPS delivery protein PorZ [Neolewinella litorea]|uniref:PorZ N-terminal beta-propeller domain-containing protein n=1 Tax=Neolewinella litorea TaxID=2562452 RepID=A0A4S4NI70_9BACT|nr:hypothetical protein [Neolewinella litorea]THH39434.1 hypothetical protein E4021_11825 [Neolewinella litorea]
MLKQLLLGMLLLLTAAALRSQVDSIGQWHSLQSFASGAYVTQSAESIIYTTGNVVFFLDKEDLSIRPLTRTDGLAGGQIDLIKYHPPTETLIIVYENSTIDLYRRGQFSTLRQIDNFNFSGDKRIYDVTFGENNTIYLAAGYGLSSLSLDEQIFNFTTFTGVRVNSVVAYGGHLYAATDEGLYRAPLQGVNLNDFNRWDLLGFADGLPGDYTSATLTTWQGALYFAVDDDVYRLQDGTIQPYYDAPEADNRLEYLNGQATLLLAGYRCTTGNCADRLVLDLGASPGTARPLPDCAYRTNYAIEDERGRIWFGDDAEDIRYLTGPAGDCRRLAYPGPPKDRVYRMTHDGTSLWVAPGQLDENTTPAFDADGVWRYTDGSWTTFTPFNTPALRGRNGAAGGDDDFLTIIDVDYDPLNRVHYFSSFFEGVVGRDAEGEFTLYDETNSSLELAPDAGPGRIRAAGAATDQQGYTYFAVSRAEANGIVSVRSPDGQWAALGQSCNLNIAIDIAVDDFGYVWVVHRGGSNGGLTVIDPMGTPMDPSDDRCRTILASSQNQLPTNQTRSIAVDLEGNVWVGTAEGIVIFTCPGTVFDTELCTGYRPLVSADDGFGGYLLETEEIRTIAVDGGNRKWIGTNGGAFLLSEAGDEQLLKFDRGNSPLLDDVVKSIAIDPVSGTVFFGTELGIISYRGTATAAAEIFVGELEVFPNPVEPGYDGPIAIRGLARNARVKITDLSGKLVEEGLATGGQFTWQGTDYNGRRVTTGVYLVFASSNRRFAVENPGSAVAKIVFIR